MGDAIACVSEDEDRQAESEWPSLKLAVPEEIPESDASAGFVDEPVDEALEQCSEEKTRRQVACYSFKFNPAKSKF